MIRFALIYVALLFVLLLLLKFNGLYGQDAFQYVYLSQAYKAKLSGLLYSPQGPGDSEFAVGYPLLGAIFLYLGIPGEWVLPAISLVSAGTCLYFFERCLALLSHGTRRKSRRVYALLLLGAAPVFVRSALCVMSDAMGLAFLSISFFYGLRSYHHFQRRDLWLCAIGAGLAVLTRFALAAVMLPFVLLLAYQHRKRWMDVLGAGLLGMICLLPHAWIRAGASSTPLSHSMFEKWSFAHFFQRSFENENGISSYKLPNLLYTLLTFCHPTYFLLLPLFFLLSKRTDLARWEQRSICLCLGIYLLFIAGIPLQNLRFLLPAYFLLLLLMFPAWDRMFAYGFYFLKNRYMLPILIFSGLLLLAGNVKTLYPTVQRNHLERNIAAGVRKNMPNGSVLYAFDLDGALKHYLPVYQYVNLWEHAYDSFQEGSYVLFNEPLLQKQWAGKNPMINWAHLQEKYVLKTVEDLEGGWTLYQVVGRR